MYSSVLIPYKSGKGPDEAEAALAIAEGVLIPYKSGKGPDGYHPHRYSLWFSLNPLQIREGSGLLSYVSDDSAGVVLIPYKSGKGPDRRSRHNPHNLCVLIPYKSGKGPDPTESCCGRSKKVLIPYKSGKGPDGGASDPERTDRLNPLQIREGSGPALTLARPSCCCLNPLQIREGSGRRKRVSALGPVGVLIPYKSGKGPDGPTRERDRRDLS